MVLAIGYFFLAKNAGQPANRERLFPADTFETSWCQITVTSLQGRDMGSNPIQMETSGRLEAQDT